MKHNGEYNNWYGNTEFQTESKPFIRLILESRPATERHRYFVTTSLIGFVQA